MTVRQKRKQTPVRLFGAAGAAAFLTGLLTACSLHGTSALLISYDYREEGRAPAVRDQGENGDCWAFAALTALETSLLPDEPYRFSADHMIRQNGFSLAPGQGGSHSMSMAYLLSWQGPVPEAADPYGDGISPEGLSSVIHVQEVRILPDKDYEAIKEAVYRYGGVESSLYTAFAGAGGVCPGYDPQWASYCYRGEELPDHDVVIVGWDDEYPRERFSTEVSGDGAFLCLSSWGEQFGQDGYFYVSYYDRHIGTDNVVYTRADRAYDRIYQTDLCGWTGQLGLDSGEAWGANVYQAPEAVQIRAAGFYATVPEVSYEIYGVAAAPEQPLDFSDRKQLAHGKLEYSGFFTAEFSEPMELAEGQEFAVIVKLTAPEPSPLLAAEYPADEATASVILSDGRGFLSRDGLLWEPLEERYGCNLCLKAYGTVTGR